MQAFTPFVRVATDATRHFATFGLAPAAAFFIPNPARHPFQGWDWETRAYPCARAMDVNPKGLRQPMGDAID